MLLASAEKYLLQCLSQMLLASAEKSLPWLCKMLPAIAEKCLQWMRQMLRARAAKVGKKYQLKKIRLAPGPKATVKNLELHLRPNWTKLSTPDLWV